MHGMRDCRQQRGECPGRPPCCCVPAGPPPPRPTAPRSLPLSCSPSQLAWWLERAARLAYLRQTEAVEAEWKLERKRRPLGTLGPELAGLLLVCWQAMDLWLGATAAQSPI